MTKTQEREFEKLWIKAQMAGLEAGEKVTPVPMIVSQHRNMADDSSPVQKQWYVDGGVCGFGWVNIKPANSPFANWLKKQSSVRTYKGYYGGLEFGIHQYGQSYEKKMAHAAALANVLNEGGIKAYAGGRLD